MLLETKIETVDRGRRFGLRLSDGTLQLWHIEGHHKYLGDFVAGVEVDPDTNVIIRAAPVLKAWRGTSLDRLIAHAAFCRWAVTQLE